VIEAPDPSAAYERASRRKRRLPSDAACAECSAKDPDILEAHHVGGAANDDTVVILCLNHHRRVTNNQQDEGALPPGRAETSLERLCLMHRSLGALFPELGASHLRSADVLERIIARLDEHYPGWRDDEELR
jgi:hypothetical protein